MTQPIRALLVDDEAGCLSNLQHYLAAHCPRLEVVGTAGDPEAAARLLRTLPVDIAFLDIHLFNQNVFDLLPGLCSPDLPRVFVTAYGQYALDAFRASALDYLLKPLETADVLRCYGKIARYFDGASPPGPAAAAATRKITLRQGDRVYLVAPEALVLLRAQGFYTEVCFEYGGGFRTLVLSKPLHLVQEGWPAAPLVRVHRSYAVNLQKVTGMKKHGAGYRLELAGGGVVPVAKRRAADFLQHCHG